MLNLVSLPKILQFYLISWCGNCGNCVFLQNFQTKKLGEITVFFAVYKGQRPIQNLSQTSKIFDWVLNRPLVIVRV